MAAGVGAGLGYLAAGLASGAIEVALIRYRRELARWYIEKAVSMADRTSPRWRWRHGTWANPKWRDEQFRERSLYGIWLPPVLGFLVLTVVFLGAAAAAFSA
jgi:hypothetical protein